MKPNFDLIHPFFWIFLISFPQIPCWIKINSYICNRNR